MLRRTAHVVTAAAICWTLLAAPPAIANVDVVRTHVPDFAVVGQGRMSYLFWDLYEATLYAPDGQWRHDRPFALALTYLRSLHGARIAEVSAEEIARLETVAPTQLTAWRAQMTQIFPDVNAGVQLTGIRAANGQTLFYRDDELIGRIADPEFGRLFFGIWLHEQTSAAALRSELLGRPNQ